MFANDRVRYVSIQRINAEIERMNGTNGCQKRGTTFNYDSRLLSSIFLSVFEGKRESWGIFFVKQNDFRGLVLRICPRRRDWFTWWSVVFTLLFRTRLWKSSEACLKSMLVKSAAHCTNIPGIRSFYPTSLRTGTYRCFVSGNASLWFFIKPLRCYPVRNGCQNGEQKCRPKRYLGDKQITML